MMTAYNKTGAKAAARLVKTGQKSVQSIAADTLSHIVKCEPVVQAFAYLNPDLVTAQAAAIDAAEVKGPLAGVTVGIKDVIATRDMPTEHNNARYRGVIPGVDAACVDSLRAAGALMIGKTVTTEFAATQRGGVTRNPHDLSRSPGGSSSGSAAAVAAGMCSVGLGTQTGGSTIRPASFCGIWGWKPSWNTISREGLKVYSLTCDTLGLYARQAEDLGLLADVFDLDAAPQPASLEGLRIGLCRGPMWDRVQPAMRDALDQAVRTLRLSGAEVIEVYLPDLFNGLNEAHGKILYREGRAAFYNEFLAQPEMLHEEFKDMARNARGLTAGEMRAAYTLADSCRATLDEVMAGLDAILTPSACDEAPVGTDFTGDPSMNSIWTLLQVPVVSVPGLSGPNNMPLGMSIITPRYTDRTTIAIGQLVGEVLALEEAMA